MSSIYDFLRSPDIAEHCLKIGHTFTPLEQAVIIYHSNLNLESRHKGWQKIIDTLPDEKIIERPGEKGEKIHHESLHEYLRELMRIENTLADSLKAEEPNAVYSYSIRYSTESEAGFIKHRSYDNTAPYSSYNAVVKAAEEANTQVSEYSKWLDKKLHIHKRWIDTDKELTAEIVPTGEINYFYRYYTDDISEADRDLFIKLSLIDVYVPVR